MKTWQRLILIALIGSFPMGVHAFMRSEKSQTSVETASIEGVLAPGSVNVLDRDIELKIKEIGEIDTKILVNRGERLNLIEQRHIVIQDLERIQNKIRPIIESAKGKVSASN